VTRPAVTPYGDRNANAPRELDIFSFLVGKWTGTGKAKLPDGKVAEFPVTWIGRYILDGTAIEDELHSLAPDGSPYLGISLRQYDARAKVWIVEYLNVSGNFIRRQVNGDSGSVSVAGPTVTVVSESDDAFSKEHYRVADKNTFVYTIEISSDHGKTWAESQIEMTLHRA